MSDALADMLGSLVAVFPHPEPTPERMRAYRAALADLTPDECRRAFLVLARQHDRKFYPSPGEILASVRTDQRASEVGPLYDRIECAIVFDRATPAEIARRFGPAAWRAVKAVGMQEIRVASNGEGRTHERRRFIEEYRGEEQLEEAAALLPVALDSRVKALVATIGREVK